MYLIVSWRKFRVKSSSQCFIWGSESLNDWQICLYIPLIEIDLILFRRQTHQTLQVLTIPHSMAFAVGTAISSVELTFNNSAIEPVIPLYLTGESSFLNTLYKIYNISLSKSASILCRWSFIQCQNYAGLARVGDDDLARSCAKLNGHDWDEVKSCVEGPEGRKLLRLATLLAHDFDVQKSCSIYIGWVLLCLCPPRFVCFLLTCLGCCSRSSVGLHAWFKLEAMSIRAHSHWLHSPHQWWIQEAESRNHTNWCMISSFSSGFLSFHLLWRCFTDSWYCTIRNMLSSLRKNYSWCSDKISQ